jgi:hypothetical protein
MLLDRLLTSHIGEDVGSGHQAGDEQSHGGEGHDEPYLA